MNIIKRIYLYIRYGKWEVVRTGFPYKHGYGTYNKRKNTVMHTGLDSRIVAETYADELNMNRGKP